MSNEEKAFLLGYSLSERVNANRTLLMNVGILELGTDNDQLNQLAYTNADMAIMTLAKDYLVDGYMINIYNQMGGDEIEPDINIIHQYIRFRNTFHWKQPIAIMESGFMNAARKFGIA